MANSTDAILKAIAETAEEYAKLDNDEVFDIAPRNVIFAARKALEAREALREAAGLMRCVPRHRKNVFLDYARYRINKVLED